MGRFGAAAILAALCPALCLYGSRERSGGDFQYAARNKLYDTFGTKTMGSSLCLLSAVHSEDLEAGRHITDLSARRIPISRSSSDSEQSQGANYQVKYHHEVMTLHREMCSI